MTGPLVYIVVLCHNSRKWLPRCLGSLLKTDYRPFRVVVVDNNSVDGSPDLVKADYPEVELIENRSNLGWCRGNNRGIRHALERGADYICFFNSDIEAPAPDWLSRLVDFAGSHRDYGIYGCLQYEYDAPGFQRLNGWSRYILESGNRDALYMWDKDLKDRFTGPAYTEEDIVDREFLECYFVQGAAMMVKGEVFGAIGLFDAIYFIFYDGVGFSRGARAAGYKTALLPGSKIKHYEAGDNFSNRRRRRRRNYYYSRNKYIFLLTDTGRGALKIAGIISQWIVHDIKDAVGSRRDISGVLQFLIITLSLFVKLPAILAKRYREREGRRSKRQHPVS
jgi:GT2 family glycosyltransferase